MNDVGVEENLAQGGSPGAIEGRSPHVVILSDGEAAAKDLCTSADTTNPDGFGKCGIADGAPYLPSVGRCGVPTAPTPSDHPLLLSYEDQLNSLTPDQLSYAAGFMGLVDWDNDAVLNFLRELYVEDGPNPELLNDFRKGAAKRAANGGIDVEEYTYRSFFETRKIPTMSLMFRQAEHSRSASHDKFAGVIRTR